ncbi:MAG: hypothetical protein IPP48_01315 [Chitinophagaceae bacterium]|nr:hypothetical protein [Chitinophagaceae bacterium]
MVYPLEIFISRNLKKSNSFAQKEYPTWNAIIDGKVNSSILIYGSSRAWVNINPTMIGDSLHQTVYNIGIDGHNFWLQKLRDTLLLKNNVKPKLIIQSLDMFTLQKREDLYNSNQFLPYMLYSNEIKNATNSYKGFSVVDYEIPLIRYYGNYEAMATACNMALNPNNNPVERIRGYQGQDISWNADFDRAKLTMKNYHVKLDTNTVTLFEQYLKKSNENNIAIIFVYSPEYVEGQKFVDNREEIINIYTQLGKKYNIPFYDFSRDSISFKKDLFYNASHLNKTGAEVFTKKLIGTLRKHTLRN